MSERPDRSTESADDAKVRELLGVLREDVRAPAGLRQVVMERIDRESEPFGARVAAWLFRPRLIPVSPALAGAAVLALAVLLLATPARTPVTLPSEAASDQPARAITRFVLVAPQARTVHVTGDFTSWSRDGFALENLRGSGIWTGDIALPPGVHQYTFVVDGNEWVADPSAVLQVNSILVVRGEGEV
jgi:hypothetical protein